MHKEIVSKKDKDGGITLPDFKTHTYMEIWLMLPNSKWGEEMQKTVVNFLWMGEVKSQCSQPLWYGESWVIKRHGTGTHTRTGGQE